MGLTDKHLAYGDDIPQTQTEKDYYWQIKHLEEQNAKLKEALRKIKDDLYIMAKYSDEYWYVYGIKKSIEIINKHTEGLV